LCTKSIFRNMVVFKLCYFLNIFSTYVILPRFLSNCIISQKNNLRNQQQILLTLLLMSSISYYLQSKTCGLTHYAHTTLFTLSYFTIDILFKFLFSFFNLILNFFLHDFILFCQIQEQLNQICWKKNKNKR
jgi:hypothetical protein